MVELDPNMLTDVCSLPCQATFGVSMSSQGRWSQERRTKAQSGLR